jgi:hypothetical protein
VLLVLVPSGFCNVVIIVLLRVLLDANVYTSFHGLIGDVVQYSFQDLVFSFLTAAWYSVLALLYWVFLPSRSASLRVVLWYLLLKAFVFFRIIVSPFVHHGTDLPFAFCFTMFLCPLFVSPLLASS